MTQQQLSMRNAGWALIVTGALFAATALPVFHPVIKFFFQLAYWPIHSVPADLALPAPLLVAIGGGLTAGLGGMLWALGTHVAGVAPDAAAKVAKIAAWIWFCTDSTGSILVGAPFNAILNLIFLALLLIPSRVRSTDAAAAA